MTGPLPDAGLAVPPRRACPVPYELRPCEVAPAREDDYARAAHILRALQAVQRFAGLYHAPRRRRRPFPTMARTIVPRRVHRDPTQPLEVVGAFRGRARGEARDWPAMGGRWV